MDNSKEYIKMCRKATEIQELWEQRWGDFYEYEEDEQILPINVGGLRRLKSYIENGVKIIWLPRQDQLQKILYGNKYTSWAILNDISNKLKDIFELYENYPNRGHMSMQQLWLAFVMHEKFSKVWVNGEWITMYGKYIKVDND